MLSKVIKIKRSQTPSQDLSELLEIVHREGPSNSGILETISLYKEFHPEHFSEYEENFISAIGLFYKIQKPENLYSYFMSTVGAAHAAQFGKPLTPVQASVRRAIDNNQFVSISAPTSAGKSYSIRDFIADQRGDAVVVVPSRALIAEYINSIKERFNGAKGVMVSAFVDNVFTARKLRHIFVLTPERARELFSSAGSLNIDVFFFDEAQMSEEKGRGIVFDVLVRRVRKIFPLAKIIFAHPFVDNPEAQLKKHRIDLAASYSRSYTHGTVGKVSVYRHSNGRDFYFSPFVKKGHHLTNCIEFNGRFEDFAFGANHSILIFVSKASIYNGKFLAPFQQYIDRLPEITKQDAINIIQAVEHMLGADSGEHRSRLVSLLRKGVVIHHGSVPLEVRFLVEEFIRGKHARICFATNTLAQGVNMPFDVVWLHSMRMNGEGVSDRALSFKNLVGRAGRLSPDKQFDYGYVFTENPTLYSERINEGYALSEESVIDTDFDGGSEDTRELIDSIRKNLFNDEYNFPQSKVERLSEPKVFDCCRTVLNVLYKGPSIRENISGDQNVESRDVIKECLRKIFVASINRDLFDGEGVVFDTAVTIFLLAITGRTFREIAGIRYSRISRRDGGGKGEAAFSQPANRLPDASLRNAYPLFKGIAAKDVGYDAVVFDTYDYMDQVISFSLSDVFSASFKIYGKLTGDRRSDRMLELLRFGTNNVVHTLLMRYGFTPESVVEITRYIQFINESEIRFSSEISSAPKYIQDMVAWYLP
jgi:hypothetical protein